ncbi:MAG: hypothetical protein JO272_13435 [Pseudonocardiales bacterium]|nr:hypothetical protein [Pseudonocardiales bacterium]
MSGVVSVVIGAVGAAVVCVEDSPGLEVGDESFHGCVLNNSGYLIERLLCVDPKIAYNDVASWRYSEIPYALGCDDWFTARVTTCSEFDEALSRAGQDGVAAYIEVVADTFAAPPMSLKLHENVKMLYTT